jgi:hypothetical protein
VLKQRGGTNLLAAFGFIILFFAAVFAIVIVEDMLLPQS